MCWQTGAALEEKWDFLFLSVWFLCLHLRFYSGHLADPFIHSDLRLVNFSEESETIDQSA